MAPHEPMPLRPRDYLLLTVYCIVLWGFAFWFDRTFSSHETIGCVNIREMLASGDWVVPTFGGRPWLERPPLPFWLTIPFVRLLGDVPAAYRLAPLCVALGNVLLVAWMASSWYGRGIGLLAALILATIREFANYAVAPECDMFLCGVVTLAMALFVHLEFRQRPAPAESGHFIGRRPWILLAFFGVVGMANWVKGLFFGDFLILLPIAAFLLLGGDRWHHVRRYVWLPGWVAFAVVGSAWALAVYLRYPDVVDLWKSDYVGRMNQGYMREPPWYYLIELPWALFPWILASLIGFAVTRRQAFTQGRTPERFLWCWGVVPILFLSIPQGKHHHYLLHAIAPWAILAALGTVRLWQWLPTLSWLSTPWPMIATLGIPGEVALALLGKRFAVPETAYHIALVAWPVLVLLLWWIYSRPNVRVAMMAMMLLLLPLHWLGHAFLTLIDDRYAADRAFMEQVRQAVPAGKELLIVDGPGPLDGSWSMYYLRDRGRLLHNVTFLAEDRVAGPEVRVVCRRWFVERMAEYGTARLEFESPRSRDAGAEWRYGLYQVRLREGLARHRGPVYVSPMQATGRAQGPDLPARTAPVARR